MKMNFEIEIEFNYNLQNVSFFTLVKTYDDEWYDLMTSGQLLTVS